ncbi:unnamed protein product [Camellia sinensis]
MLLKQAALHLLPPDLLQLSRVFLHKFFYFIIGVIVALMQIVVNLVQETYEVQWPLSLVISRKALTKYQLIFRFLFHYEHVDLQLCGAWKIHKGVRAVNTKGTAISRSCLLCRSMLKFINSLLHYLTFEACFTLPLLLVFIF